MAVLTLCAICAASSLHVGLSRVETGALRPLHTHRPLRTPLRVHRPLRMQQQYGGDLSGGTDAKRNEQVDALKRAFFSTSTAPDADSTAPTGSSDPPPAVDAATAHRLGVYVDLPIARWSMPFLPHQQVLLNVFQPQYTLMFEALLATPPPHYYLHAILPGGAAALAEPRFALPEANKTAGADAATQGTLMRIVDVQRQPDRRLALVAQGLGRAVVLRASQALPYARADVAILPDAEEMLSVVVSALRAAPRLAMASDSALDLVSQRDMLIMSAAATEEDAWREYENQPVELRATLPPAFTKFDPSSASSALGDTTDEALEASLSTAFAAPAPALLEIQTLLSESPPLQEALAAGRVLFEAFGDDMDELASAEADDLESISTLEIQLWLELDGFLRGVAALRGDGSAVPAPKQLLGLLPPAPTPGGWPVSFVLDKVAKQLAADSAEQEADDPEPYVELHPEYPARRRAQRLSYSVWLVIREEGLELQPLLETASTSDRLRMALIRLRELAERLPPAGETK